MLIDAMRLPPEELRHIRDELLMRHFDQTLLTLIKGDVRHDDVKGDVRYDPYAYKMWKDIRWVFIQRYDKLAVAARRVSRNEIVEVVETLRKVMGQPVPFPKGFLEPR